MIFNKLTKNAIIHKDQGYAFYFYHKGQEIVKVHGILGDEKSNKITTNTNFRLASVSKQFIAFATINLINEKLINYDTKINEIFENLPDYFNHITVKHLLNHTSGIYDYEDMPHSDDKQIVDNDIIDFLNTTSTTYFVPGSKYKYSNTGYILLGLIVEKVSKRSIADYIKKEIFHKADMSESKVNIQGKTIIKNRAYGHLIDENNKLFVKDQYWCSATIGDGGLYSSVEDLKKWCKYLVTTSNFQDMKVANYIGADDYNEYGCGIRIIKESNNEIIYHCGDTIGTNTLLLFSIDLDICLIFLTNLGKIDTSIIKNNLLDWLREKK